VTSSTTTRVRHPASSRISIRCSLCHACQRDADVLVHAVRAWRNNEARRDAAHIAPSPQSASYHLEPSMLREALPVLLSQGAT
jgi:hypothetical protein